MSQPPSQQEIYQRLVESLSRNWPALLGSITALATGIWLIFDDLKDYGKVDRPTHHVYTGFIPFIGGLIGLGFTCVTIIGDVYPWLRLGQQQVNQMKQYSKALLEAMR